MCFKHSLYTILYAFEHLVLYKFKYLNSAVIKFLYIKG